jgi:hypothetical protein
VTVALLVFVASSLAYLVAGETGGRRGAATPAASISAEPRVVAYYFHATMRCPTCLSIERGARAALESAFGPELAGGVLEWRAVDMEAPGNEHFVKDFGLTASSLVLVKEAGGRVADWRNLERVWELVGDDPRFEAYVVENARGFLTGS